MHLEISPGGGSLAPGAGPDALAASDCAMALVSTGSSSFWPWTVDAYE